MENYSRHALFLLILVALGCGRGDWGELNGTVQLNGQPIGPGIISLEPVDVDRPGAMAFFAEDGEYSVISSGRKEGAPIGEYRVSIQGGSSEDFGAESAEPAPPSKIPVRYGNYESSELTVTIEPGSNAHDFELEP